MPKSISVSKQHKFGKEIDFPTKTVALVFFDFGINDIDVGIKTVAHVITEVYRDEGGYSWW